MAKIFYIKSIDLLFFFALTFPGFHLLPHLVVDDSRRVGGLDHHAGHPTLSGQPRSANDNVIKTLLLSVEVSRPLCVSRLNCGK